MSDKTKIEWHLITAAKRIGVSPECYAEMLSMGMKWCTACKEFHRRARFLVDVSRGDGLSAACHVARKEIYTRTYVRVPAHLRKPCGPAMQAPREGDKQQARKTVNLLVRTGRLTPPKDVPCVDCGHKGRSRRHEYDHYLGYEAENHLAVQVVCSRCHCQREMKRGKWGRQKLSGRQQNTQTEA